ncbi:MAG: hypothetical protein DRP45_03745 [Candidatus Zixiibacteriota bacterium]|nr:MAG: hypothetical protein DRP45_03745 [candidate division Zixibacteria bacterium]
MKNPLLMFLCLAVVVTGCGRKGGPGAEQGTGLTSDKYQTIWVEPEVTVSDSLVTLIRAERIDSIEVRNIPAEVTPSASIEFVIEEPICNVSISLLDGNQMFLYPVMVRNLGFGYYRLTLNTSRLNSPRLPSGRYCLRADILKSSITACFDLR